MERPFIVEWWSLPKTFAHGFYIPASLIFLAMALCVALFTRRVFRAHPAAFCILAVLAGMGILHHRHGIFFAIGFLVYIPAHVGKPLPEQPGHSLARIFFKVLAGVCLFLSMSLTLYQSLFLFSGSPLSLRAPSLEDAPINAPYYPTGAVDRIRELGLRGNILADFHWGEYLMWSLHPECQVAVDGRYETVYPEDIVNEHFLCFENPRVHSRDLIAYIEKYPTEMLITTPGSAVHNLLGQASAWEVIYQDRGCVLVGKKKAD